MLGLLIALIGIVIIVAIAWWFLSTVPIPAPFDWIVRGLIAVVLIILYLALRSPKIIVAVVATTLVGLVVTAALGLWMTGALNPISVAFAVLFVGIGVDFSIQYSVRYRAERHQDDDLAVALKNTAINVGVPLTLAAATTAAGFFSFLPTSYGGFSELGAIAGVGMIVAWAASIVLLPALLAVLNPPAEKEELGYRALAPVDRFCERHRIKIVVGTLALVGLGAPLLYFLRFDFNPMNLRSPKAESIATYLDLRRDPMTGASAIFKFVNHTRIKGLLVPLSIPTLAIFAPMRRRTSGSGR